ncbi:MAG: dTDP-4-dehydrorhamnose 3,5-epimerase [Actinobacteria bacterium]|nr:dTDP-4-dehydrorhamnose 3,5-epimerase [Actinomycetota bacterium]
MISGLTITPLKTFRDHRGSVLHMMRSDSPLFSGFGEVYFSSIGHRAVKAWRRNHFATANFAVPVGSVELVAYDDRDDSATRDSKICIMLDADNYHLVTIPPRVWYGFVGLAEVESLIVNLLNRPYDAAAADQREYPSIEIPHEWDQVS